MDPNTIEITSTSSPETFSFEVVDQTVTFRFDDINLPPNQNPPEGEGFVHFTINPKGDLPVGTEIQNSALIFFDFNPPISTPTVAHEIIEPESPPSPPRPSPSAIGGEMIPIDTPTLILAGAQMNAVWMIIVIVSAVGIGIVIVRKF